MISVQEAERIILEHAPLLPTVPCPLASAHGRILREAIAADRDQPPYDRITMDGIAFAFRALEQGTRNFHIEAIHPAGQPAPALKDAAAGCLQVMTGAILPTGCDCIVPFEEIDVTGDTATLKSDCRPKLMQYVHRQGTDRRAGEMLLAAGCMLRSPEIGMAAAAGYAQVTVSGPLTATVISNGDELVELSSPIQPYQVRRSNTYAMRAALVTLGLQEVQCIHTPDDPAAIEHELKKALAHNGVIILSGGVSMGKYDYVPAALERLSVKPLFHKVLQKPGKPLWFGLGPTGQTVFALPGNPVSSLVCFHRYVIPYLRKRMGAPAKETARVFPGERITPHPDLTLFIPVRLRQADDGRPVATPVPYHGSGDLSSLGQTDGFVELAPAAVACETTTLVPFHPWSC